MNSYSDPAPEIRRFEAFLDRHGLCLADNASLMRLQSDELLTVCALNHQLIFWSSPFLAVSSYDIPTLLFNPWFRLFKRDDNLQAAVESFIDEVLKKRADWVEPELGLHLLSECHEGHDRRFECRLSGIGGILDRELGEPMGYTMVMRLRHLRGGQNISHLR